MKRRLLLLACMSLLFAGCGESTASTPSSTTTEKVQEELPVANTEANVSSDVEDTVASTESNNNNEEISDMESTYELIIEQLSIPKDQETIYANLYRPDTTEPVPLIIMCHGYNGSANDFAAEGRYYATHGIAACSIDFCGGSNNSRSTGLTTDMTIFTEKADLLATFNYFKDQTFINHDKVFLFGGSQGGLVTTLATEELQDEVAGMALYFPALCIPDNWRDTYKEESEIPEENEFWGMKLGGDFFRSIRDFYVFDEIGSYSGNVLIVHGDKDDIAPLSYSQQAIELYPNAELIILEGEGHGFSPNGATTARDAVFEFLQNNL